MAVLQSCLVLDGCLQENAGQKIMVNGEGALVDGEDWQ